MYLSLFTNYIKNCMLGALNRDGVEVMDVWWRIYGVRIYGCGSGYVDPTTLCWECSLCRVLGYTSKYDGMRNSRWCLLQFIKPHKTAPMFIQEREEKLIERFSLRFSYCSYTFHHHYVNQRQYHFIWKVFTSCRQHLTVHCKHKRDKDTSWHQWICFFFPDIKLYLNIFALSNKLWTVSCCILWYLVVSYFN